MFMPPPPTINELSSKQVAGLQVASGTHAFRPSDIGCQKSGSIYTTRLIVWQPRHAADTSTNWRQSLFLLLHREHGTGYWWSWNCCDRRTCFVVICFILSTGTRIRIDSVMRPRSSVAGAIQVPQLQLQLQLQLSP